MGCEKKYHVRIVRVVGAEQCSALTILGFTYYYDSRRADKVGTAPTYFLLLRLNQKFENEKQHLNKRVRGIEPLSLAWKAKVLPLNYTRRFFQNTYTIIAITLKFGKDHFIERFIL